jgi:hypothetical protein
VLGSDEKDRVRRPNPLAEGCPFCRRIVIAVLVVDLQLADLDDAELQPRGRQLGERVGYLRLIESFLRLPTITATSRGLSMRNSFRYF